MECIGSLSFATTTKISYAGKTSGDLESIPWYASAADPALQQADEDLLKFVQTTETQLMTNAGSQPAVEPALATISGSNTIVRYNVAIHNDGSATAATLGIEFMSGRTQEFPPATIDTKTLLLLLTEIGDVSRIPAEPCPKPIPREKRQQRFRMRARPAEICKASRHPAAIRRSWTHLKSWPDSCRRS